MRFSHVLLAHAARGTGPAEPVLIYGTAAEARHALRRMRRRREHALEPIGFVASRPRRRASEVARLPVLGGAGALAGIIRRHRVRHLVIADPALRGDTLDWIRAICRHQDVRVHRYVERLVPYERRAAAPADLAAFRPAADRWRQRTGAPPLHLNGNGNGSQSGTAYSSNGNGTGGHPTDTALPHTPGARDQLASPSDGDLPQD
jgi:hypothetical protein